MKYNKLVRDRIPEIIEKDGKKAITRILDDEEYKIYLEKKLDEEVAELHASKSIEEIADVLEVVWSLARAYGYSIESVSTHRVIKNIERGGFAEKILLVEVCEGDNNERKRN